MSSTASVGTTVSSTGTAGCVEAVLLLLEPV